MRSLCDHSHLTSSSCLFFFFSTSVEQGFCSNPWIPYNSHCFYLNRSAQTWANAQKECRKEGGDLVSIQNVEEQSFVISQLGFGTHRKHKTTNIAWLFRSLFHPVYSVVLSLTKMCALRSFLSTISRSHTFSQSAASSDELWIGFNDIRTEGLFDWSDHSSVSFTSWTFGKPAVSTDAEDCVLITGQVREVT